MSDKMPAVKEFKVSREVADSLRLELSSVSPTKERQNRELVGRVAEDMISRYHQFMTAESLTTLQTAHERTSLFLVKSYADLPPLKTVCQKQRKTI